jgi:hypothetical protein
MLPQEESLDILIQFLLENVFHKVQAVPIDAIRKLARIVLTENVFIYEKKFYRQNYWRYNGISIYFSIR